MATQTEEQVIGAFLGVVERAPSQEELDDAVAAYQAAEDEGIDGIEGVRSFLVNNDDFSDNVIFDGARELNENGERVGEEDREAIVENLYQRLFDRDPDPAGLDYWVSGGGSSVNANQLVQALIDGAEANNDTGEPDFDTFQGKVDDAVAELGLDNGDGDGGDGGDGADGGDGTDGGDGSTVTLNASNNADTVNAADADTTFNVESGTFTVGIENFEQGDALSFFDTPDVRNNDGTDGVIEVEAVNSDTGEIATVQLTGLGPSVDGSVFNPETFTDQFGADALTTGDGSDGSGGDGGDGSTEMLTLNANTNDPIDAAGADTTFNVESGNFTVSIENFEQGDALSFFGTPDVRNNDGTDGVIEVEAVNSDTGEIATVQLTGLGPGVDGSVFNPETFTDQFGADALM